MILNASSRVDAYDPRDGKPLWTADGLLSVMVVTPVFAEGLILTTGGYPSSPIVAIRPGGRGNVTDSRVVWRKNNGGNYVPSMIASEGLLFIIDDDGFATAAELETGERLWRERLGGPYSASPVAAEGRIYAIDEYGDAFVFEAGRDFKLLGRNPLGERVVASPAIAGRRIYLRTVHHLYAIGGGN
jgi:outer membrane protein assembly factor BamB